jgi:hypothetical protein
MATLFERLAQGRPQQAKKPGKRSHRNADRVSRWKRKTEAEIFLVEVLAHGPMPSKIVEELGAARKFSKRTLEGAKKRRGITAFKKKGKLHDCWFWTLEPGAVRKPHSRFTPYLRGLTKSLGYRLTIDKNPRSSRR